MYSEPDFREVLSPQEEGHLYHTVNAFVDLIEKHGWAPMMDLLEKRFSKRQKELGC